MMIRAVKSSASSASAAVLLGKVAFGCVLLLCLVHCGDDVRMAAADACADTSCSGGNALADDTCTDGACGDANDGSVGECVGEECSADSGSTAESLPEGYLDACADDPTICVEPYECLEYQNPISANPSIRCSVKCTSSEQCPAVIRSHCGDVTSCDDGVCGYQPCG